MTLSFDPEIAEVVRAAQAALGEIAVPPRGDALALRESILSVMVKPETCTGADRRTYFATAADGTEIELRWYTRGSERPGSAVLYIHGGGMICGSLDLYEAVSVDYVVRTGVPILAVEYRLAPESAHPGPVEDCYAALHWLFAHAESLNVSPDRIAVLGDSAGGGIAAALALLACDRGLSLARQILIYPMLDDRNVEPDPELVPFANWTFDNNYTGWKALLGADFGTEDISHYAAPARAADLRARLRRISKAALV